MDENFVSAFARLEEAVKTQGKVIDEMKSVMTEEFKFLRSDRHDIRALIHKHDLQLSDRACSQHTKDLEEMKADIGILKRNMWIVIGGAVAISSAVGFVFELIKAHK